MVGFDVIFANFPTHYLAQDVLNKPSYGMKFRFVRGNSVLGASVWTFTV